MTEVVFVHGALVRDGDWWWGPTARLLLADGIPSRPVALPSCGEAPLADGATGLAADAAALRAVLDDVPDGAIVVGHSYGGTVIAATGAHPAVRALVLVSSYLPDRGASQAAIMGDEPDPVRIAQGPGGTLVLDGYDADSFGDRFLQRSGPAVRAAAWERVTPQAASSFTTPTDAAGWRGVDSTYLVCTEDRSTTVGLQRRHAARATRSVDLPTGHHPFIEQPELVAEQVRRIARRL